MELLFFIVLFGGIFAWAAMRKKPEVTDWKVAPEYTNESQEGPIAETEYTAKHYYNPTDDIYRFIRTLLYIGKADAQLREDEINIIIEFLRQQQPEHRDSETWFLASNIRDTKPFTTEEYNTFINNLDKDNLSALLVWFQRITGTQKKNHPFEDHLLTELQNLLSRKT